MLLHDAGLRELLPHAHQHAEVLRLLDEELAGPFDLEDRGDERRNVRPDLDRDPGFLVPRRIAPLENLAVLEADRRVAALEVVDEHLEQVAEPRGAEQVREGEARATPSFTASRSSVGSGAESICSVIG